MILTCEAVKKDYGNGKGLSDFTMTFRPGIYGILGPNGSGKSTMMNLLTDNVARSSGRILLDGQDILTLGADYRKRVGYMPQQQGFYPRFSPMAFLKYMGGLKGIPSKQAREEGLRLLEAVNLKDAKDDPIGSFSGGMCQRVLLAQALLGDPDILLLDEPTAGLDPKERIRIRNLISGLAGNKIILIATHIVSDIESIADQVLLLKQGKLLRTGTAEELEQAIADKVREYPAEELPVDAERRFRVANVFRREGQNWLRLIGDDLPDGGKAPDHLNLEDVYLYDLENGGE